MRFTLASLALAAVVAAAPQGVTSAIAPQSSSPAGCQASYSGSFQIETVNVTKSKRDLEARQANVLTLTLANGILKDSKQRIGYIAANSQFQFDGPPQTGAIYTAGWSVCANGTLAIGGTAIFQQCLSGTFYNLYLENNSPQCSPIYITVIPASGSTPSGAASQLPDGQPTASPVVPICQLSDGQPQATSCAKPITQISDGQIQATSAKAPVTQISDGQVQATSAKAPVTQISDGQVQATSAKAPVTQISDGQVQATTAKNPVTQISDGQIQATTAKNPVTQIGDGQIQGPTGRASGTGAVPTAKLSASASSRAVASYTGAAAMPTAFGSEIIGLAVGALAVALI